MFDTSNLTHGHRRIKQINVNKTYFILKKGEQTTRKKTQAFLKTLMTSYRDSWEKKNMSLLY